MKIGPLPPAFPFGPQLRLADSLSSRRKGDLKTHVLIKHRDQAGLADLVSKSRSSKSGKPFNCPVPTCPSGYSRKGDLDRHVRKNHSITFHDDKGSPPRRDSRHLPGQSKFSWKGEA